MACWLCYFEAFHFDGEFYPVELVLLNSQTKVCSNYNIYWQHGLPYTGDTPQHIKFQYRRHGIRWDAGNVTLQEAIKLVKEQIANDDVIYIKGHEKYQWLSQWFENVKAVPEYII